MNLHALPSANSAAQRAGRAWPRLERPGCNPGPQAIPAPSHLPHPWLEPTQKLEDQQDLVSRNMCSAYDGARNEEAPDAERFAAWCEVSRQRPAVRRQVLLAALQARRLHSLNVLQRCRLRQTLVRLQQPSSLRAGLSSAFHCVTAGTPAPGLLLPLRAAPATPWLTPWCAACCGAGGSTLGMLLARCPVYSWPVHPVACSSAMRFFHEQ